MFRCSIAAVILAACAVSGQPPAAPPELHVVSVYEGQTKTGAVLHGGKAAAHVDRPGKDVTLVLSAYDSVTWDVTASPKTKLVKVIVGGYHRQAANVPAGVSVVEAFREGREQQESVLVPYKLDSAALRPAVRAVHNITGLEIASFRGEYRASLDKPFVVDGVKQDPRLASDFPKVSPAAELPKVKFPALHFVPQMFGRSSTSVGVFTEAGPDRALLRPLPAGIVGLTFDPTGMKYYGLTNNEIHEVDLNNMTSTKLDPGLGVPRVSGPCGITFDTKRERLVVATLHGSGVLYEYTPKTGAWGVIADMQDVDLAALAYNPKDDTLYGIATTRGGDGGVVLHRYNAKGALVKTVELGTPVFPGLVGRSHEGSTQLVVAGDHIALLTGPGNRPGRGLTESFLFLIDPKTDKAKLAWKE